MTSTRASTSKPARAALESRARTLHVLLKPGLRSRPFTRLGMAAGL